MTRAELIQFINANIYPNGRNQITAPMVRDSILAVVGFLGDAAVKDIGAVLENNTDLVTGGAVYDAIRAYLSSVMKMVGETTTDVITNPTANPVYVDGEPHTAQKGDVVVYGYKEFWWTGSIWKELGDEASWALKTISITGTGDLTGGGTLEANRTLDLTQSAKDKLAHGETAFSWLESYSTNRLRLKSPYSYLNARKGLILEEETDYTNTPADFVKQVVTVGETEYTILRSRLPIVSDSFISAGGISPGGGASGTTLQAVWDSLTTNTGDYANAKIHSGHIPLGSGLGVDGSGNIYVTSQGTVTGIKIGSTTYTPSAGSTIVDISSGIPTSMAWSAITSTPTTLAGYGITDAKIESGVITLGSSTITPLTSHQTIYTLTMQVGGSQIGTYTPNSAAQTINISKSHITSALGNEYHPYQGSSSLYMVASYYSLGTQYTPAGASSPVDSKIVWDSTNSAWHLIGNFYADGFISAGGISSGGGTSGIDLAAMWASLQNNDIGTSGPAYEHRNDKIHTWHLPAIVGASGISASYRAASSGSGLADYLDFSVNESTLASALSGNWLSLGGGTMSNTNLVSNLNADLLDGREGAGYFKFKNDQSEDIRSTEYNIAGYGTLSQGFNRGGPALRFGSSDGYYHKEIIGDAASNTLFLRTRTANVWSSERQFAFTDSTVAAAINATNATYATYDSASNQISTYYLPLSAGSGKALTGSLYSALLNPIILKPSSSGESYIQWQTSNGLNAFEVGIYLGGTYPRWYIWDATAHSSPLNVYGGRVGIGTATLPDTYALEVGGTFNATTIYQNGTALGGAAFYGVTDSSSASAIGTGTSLVTERDIYYGLPSINGVHTYTSSDSIYAVTSTGTAGYVTIADSNGKPSWTAQSNIAAGSATNDSAGNNISTYYLPLSAGSGKALTGTLYIGSITDGAAIRISQASHHIEYAINNSVKFQIGLTSNTSNPNLYFWNNTSRVSTIVLTNTGLDINGSATATGGITADSFRFNSSTGMSRGDLFTGAFSANDIGLNVGGGSGKLWLYGGAVNIGTTYNFSYALYVEGSVVATGAITAGAASDARLKENIKTISHDSARDLIMALHPVTFKWNALATSLYDKYEGADLGFVAQEVEPLMPMAISTIFNDYKRLDQTKFIAPLVAVAQSHETRIRELESRVKKLEEENKRLKAN